MGLFDRRRREEPAPSPVPRSPAEDQFRAAMELSNQERHAEAAAAFRRVAELDPACQPEMVHYGLALAYDCQGDSARAVDELHKVLAVNPAQVDAHFLLGTIHARANRLEPAIREYETVLQMRPGHELADEIRRSIAQWKLDLSGGPLADLGRDLELFISQARGQLGVDLDFSPSSLKVMDGLIDGGWDPRSGGLGVLHLAGTYVGEVIIRNLGGRWSTAGKLEESEIEGLGAVGIKPFFMAADKFRRGRAASLFETYRRLAAELARAGGAHG
jgi:tetratricopeptide (TPR) repeat protein